MITILNKETHVFIKNEKTFTAISKKKVHDQHQIFTTMKLTPQMADQIDQLYSANIEVNQVNLEKGFLFIRIKKGTYRDIVRAVKTVLYGER